MNLIFKKMKNNFYVSLTALLFIFFASCEKENKNLARCVPIKNKSITVVPGVNFGMPLDSIIAPIGPLMAVNGVWDYDSAFKFNGVYEGLPARFSLRFSSKSLYELVIEGTETENIDYRGNWFSAIKKIYGPGSDASFEIDGVKYLAHTWEVCDGPRIRYTGSYIIINHIAI